MIDKKESEIRAALTATLRNAEAIAQPIESGSTGNGIPDVFVAHKGVGTWIELKIGEVVKGELRVDFRPGQRAWLREHYEQGGVSILHVFLNENRTHYFFHGPNIKDAYPFPNVPFNFSCTKLNGAALLAWFKSIKETL